MTTVSGITNRVSPTTASRRVAALSVDGSDVETTPGRALVALAPVAPTHYAPQPSRRPRADFLAHLIATKERLPQAREKRRAEPQDVIQTYLKVRDAVQPKAHITLALTA